MTRIPHRSVRPFPRILPVLAVALFALGGCGDGARDGADAEATVPPGALNDGPVVKRVPYADLEYASDGSFTLDGEKFTGVAVEYHDDGETMAKLYEYKDGQFDGTTREYYANGQISATTQWENGQRHGPNIYWDEQGKEIKRQRYEHGVAVETIIPNDAAPNPANR